MSGTIEGPEIAALVRRLAECPQELLSEEPRVGEAGTIVVAAVVWDLLVDLGGASGATFDLGPFASVDPNDRNRLRLVLVAAWLLHDEWLRARRDLAERALALLRDAVAPLAPLVAAEKFVTDPDRREELARLCLARLGFVPRGESDAQAQDRFNALDTVERHRVVEAARAAEKRAREVREEMARKAAEEAAAKVARE